ncbi:MAG: TolC family protein [Deltaproteobacteria bacterium]|nr:TolC family protein [Deltaproteobacteria bacterium]TDJ02178.1 MAG: TolC family protein [Deltaproteobacteria bacterium]TDJ04245.1 MAG: TolC family protein [Deltaproteobacteria bacterium]
MQEILAWSALGVLQIAVTLSGSHAARAVETEPGPDAPLAAYFELAQRQSPAVEAARLRWEVALERVPQAAGWPDPTLRYGYFTDEVETALGPQEHRIGLAQRFPFFGKLGLRVDSAEQAALSAWHRYREKRLAVFEHVAHAYYAYAYLARAIEVTHENLTLLEGVENVVRTRYATGRAPQSDLLRVQVEVGTLEDRLRSFEEMREPWAKRLNAALGRDVDVPLPWPVPLLDPPDALPDNATVLEHVRSNSPELLALRFETREADRSLALTRRDQFPDITLGIENIRTSRSDLTNFSDSGRDAWILSVSVPIPVQRSKYRAAIREADARHRGTLVTQRDRELRLLAETEVLLFEQRDAERRIELYRKSLIPLGQQAFNAANTSFATGATSFVDTLDAERVLLQFQLELARARADRGRVTTAILARMGMTPEGVEEPAAVAR